MKKFFGSCLCGGVRFWVEGEIDQIINCFCGQCRKTSGHYVAATRVARGNLHIEKQDGLRWYKSSAEAKRGFCGICGSSLFWSAHGKETISIMAGALESPLGVKTRENWYVEDAGDYHEIPAVE